MPASFCTSSCVACCGPPRPSTNPRRELRFWDTSICNIAILRTRVEGLALRCRLRRIPRGQSPEGSGRGGRCRAEVRTHFCERCRARYEQQLPPCCHHSRSPFGPSVTDTHARRARLHPRTRRARENGTSMVLSLSPNQSDHSESHLRSTVHSQDTYIQTQDATLARGIDGWCIGVCLGGLDLHMRVCSTCTSAYNLHTALQCVYAPPHTRIMAAMNGIGVAIGAAAGTDGGEAARGCTACA